MMPTTCASWAEGSMHAIGATALSTGLVVTKTWTHTRGGATPLLAVWDADSGKLLAVIQAFAVGQLRTSAITGTATSILAPPRCHRLAVIGSGKKAEGQIAAVAAVREIHEIAVYSPTSEHCTSFAQSITEHSGITARAATSVADAVDQAEVIVTATRAKTPFINTSMLANRVHINAAGAITPERAELEPAVVARARRIVADDVAAARRLSPRELSATAAPHMLSLATALTQDERLEGDGVTIFKSLGTGISDLAVAEIVYERATAAGVGHPLPVSPRREPRLWSN